MQCARTHTIIWLNNRQLFWKANTCVNPLDDNIVARNETKVKVYIFYYYYSFLSIDSVFSCNWLNFVRHCYRSVHKNLYLAHYIFRTILVAVRFIKGGENISNPQENVSSSRLWQKDRAAFIVRLVMFKSKEKYNEKKTIARYCAFNCNIWLHHRYCKRFFVVQEQLFSC